MLLRNFCATTRTDKQDEQSLQNFDRSCCNYILTNAPTKPDTPTEERDKLNKFEVSHVAAQLLCNPTDGETRQTIVTNF